MSMYVKIFINLTIFIGVKGPYFYLYNIYTFQSTFLEINIPKLVSCSF